MTLAACIVVHTNMIKTMIKEMFEQGDGGGAA